MKANAIKSFQSVSAALKEEYLTNGIVSLTLPKNIQDLQRQFLEECQAWLSFFGGYDINLENFQSELKETAAKDRALIGRLYKASRRFPSIKQIACDPFFVDLAGQLMNTQIVSCCHFVCVRIDLPNEEKFMVESHQDFPYIQGSLDGLTVWMPFTDMSLNMGIPSFIPASHQWGLLPVEEFTLDQVGGSGGKSFNLAPDSRIDPSKFLRTSIASNQALVFHTLTVHQSEQNTSEKARVSLQIRFDNICSYDSFEKNYPEGLFLGDSFGDSFPDHVVKGEK